jgi:hypothetical protein
MASPDDESRLQQLRFQWDQADDTPGEVYNGRSKGEIWQELNSLTKKIKRPRSVTRPTHIQGNMPDIFQRNVPAPVTGQLRLMGEANFGKPRDVDEKNDGIKRSPNGTILFPSDNAWDAINGRNGA